MGTLTRETTKWSGEEDQSVMERTYNFPLSGKFVDRDMSLKINVNEMTVPAGKSFILHDGIYDWTISVDADGNVSFY